MCKKSTIYNMTKCDLSQICKADLALEKQQVYSTKSKFIHYKYLQTGIEEALPQPHKEHLQTTHSQHHS